MTLTTLDAIVRDCIMRRGYTLHWYIGFMVAAKNCLRELSMDSLRVINTKFLPVDENTNEVEIPGDYLDYARVGVQAGQYIKPLVETDKLNSIQNRTSDFAPIEYNNINTEQDDAELLYGYAFPAYWNTVTWNSFGESIGRLFGYGAGSQEDTFKVIPERNVIKINEQLSVPRIILEYISDGTDANAATQITPYAYETIAAYILWQHKLNNRTYTMADRQEAEQEFIRQHKKLRARKSPLTLEVLRRIVQKAAYGAPKSA